jgi:hypothetical protein
MEASELFRSCANEHVAAAALVCLGGALVARIDRAALPAGLTRGALVASLVAEYDRKASPGMRRQLLRGMRRAEMPILAGLRHVLEAALNQAFDFTPRSVFRSAWRGPHMNWGAEPLPFDCASDRRAHVLHS